MGNWHLEELRHALEAKGWKILAEHSGDTLRISGTWEIQRSTRRAPLFIDFDGLEDLICLTMPQSYACYLREQPDISLYFYKQRSRHTWNEELRSFLFKLDAIEAATIEVIATQCPLSQCNTR